MNRLITVFTLIAALVLSAKAESKVVLSRAGAPLETTIPGDFNTLDAILPALFSLADQAADKSAEQVFVGGRKKHRDLIFYYRGVRVVGNVVTLSFSKEAMPYFTGSVSYDATVMRAIVGTVMLYQPNAKDILLEVGGQPWKNTDA